MAFNGFTFTSADCEAAARQRQARQNPKLSLSEVPYHAFNKSEKTVSGKSLALDMSYVYRLMPQHLLR